MGREFELKFAATETAQAKIAQAYENWQSFRMVTTYYDTCDNALSARHITLRRRLENQTSVCTLKTPAGGFGRGEWELECERIEDAVEKLCKLSGWDLLPLISKGIAPICGAEFLRRACTVQLPQCTVEIALDKGKLHGGGREVPLCEVEVELKSGSEAAAVAFATELAAGYGLTPESKSKFRRGQELAKGGQNGQL